MSSRKKKEAGLAGRSASPSLGWGCGMGSLCFARCRFVTVFFGLAAPLLVGIALLDWLPYFSDLPSLGQFLFVYSVQKKMT